MTDLELVEKALYLKKLEGEWTINGEDVFRAIHRLLNLTKLSSDIITGPLYESYREVYNIPPIGTLGYFDSEAVVIEGLDKNCSKKLVVRSVTRGTFNIYTYQFKKGVGV